MSQQEVALRIQTLAAMYQMPPEKLAKDLQRRNGIVEIYDQGGVRENPGVSREKRADRRRDAGFMAAAPAPKPA